MGKALHAALMAFLIYILPLFQSVFHVGRTQGHSIYRSLCHAQVERTLAMVKPDGLIGNYTEEIKRVIAATGFVIAAEKVVQLDEAAVRIFYAEHSQREFFPSLVKFMTSGPVLAMVLEKEDAVAQWRALIGPTDAKKAKISHPKSIRAICGSDSQNNCVHGSDSHQSAAQEIAFFFENHKSGEVIVGHDEL